MLRKGLDMPQEKNNEWDISLPIPSYRPSPTSSKSPRLWSSKSPLSEAGAFTWSSFQICLFEFFSKNFEPLKKSCI